MKVNTVIKVTNLNADYLDGIDSARLIRRGADRTGTISFPSVSANECDTLSLSIAGATVGDAVILTLEGGTTFPTGLLLAGEVTGPGAVRAKLCNPTNFALPAATNLLIRVLTLR